MNPDTFATVLGLIFTAIVIGAFVTAFVKIYKSEGEKKRMEKAKQRLAEQNQLSPEEQHRRQEELKKQLLQKYTRPSITEQNDKHDKHVEDAHAHEHVGEEEHYEEIVGSLGVVNDEGCADLNGVRFIASDLAYEIQTQEKVDFDRLAQAMVLGEIVNSPRFKTPYSRRK